MKSEEKRAEKWKQLEINLFTETVFPMIEGWCILRIKNSFFAMGIFPIIHEWCSLRIKNWSVYNVSILNNKGLMYFIIENPYPCNTCILKDKELIQFKDQKSVFKNDWGIIRIQSQFFYNGWCILIIKIDLSNMVEIWRTEGWKIKIFKINLFTKIVFPMIEKWFILGNLK